MNIYRSLVSIIISAVFVLFTASGVQAQASLVTLDSNGKIIWNVLSEDDQLALDVPQASQIEVKRVAEDETTGNAKISLEKNNGKASLLVVSENGQRTLDVSDWKEAVVEIEERPQVQNIEIVLEDGRFGLRQNQISAQTDFPISVDPASANISLTTESGSKYLAILPLEAVQSVLRSKTATEIDTKGIEIVERQKDLSYAVSGNRVINLFNIYQHKVPVKTFVSASTGEVLAYEAPTWLRAINFLLT